MIFLRLPELIICLFGMSFPLGYSFLNYLFIQREVTGTVYFIHI